MMRLMLRTMTAVLVLVTARVTPTARSAAAATPTFTVNSTSDAVASAPLDNGICETAPGNGLCTLRAAIMKANHWPGGGVAILLPALPPGARYTLTIPASGSGDETSGALHVTANLGLLGGGPSQTIIDGNGSVTHDNVFYVHPGASVALIGVTIRGGKTDFGGGGIYNGGDLAVISSTVSSNVAGFGGGIDNRGHLTIFNTTVSDNHGLDGGGIYDDEINQCCFLVADTTISANSAADKGGGLAEGVGSATLADTTISGNSAGGDGGGIWVSTLGDSFLYNVTVADNQADSKIDGSGTGGGIYDANLPTSIAFRNTLIAHNYASLNTGFGYIRFPNDCYGPLDSFDYNLVAFTTGCTLNTDQHDQLNIDPVLGPLQNNGGPTWTHALLRGSPAIDAGNPGGCAGPNGAPLLTDQRGFPRKANGAGTTQCDIGAYEVQRLLNLPLVLRGR